MLSRQLEEKTTKGETHHYAGTCGFMGRSPETYAESFKAVELNFTFHDRSNSSFDLQAVNYARLGLHLVVKVSGYATHEVGLKHPHEWWPWLQFKYGAFLDADILLGLLWQLPPSFVRNAETLQRLDELGEVLRDQKQGKAWCDLPHAFEFRHSSWFQNREVTKILQRHKFHMVRSHIVNDTGWAGNLETGWHGTKEEGGTSEFVYIRCMGTDGRSVGLYSPPALHRIASTLVGSAQTAVVMFGQGDAPSQALQNARQMRFILEGKTMQETMEKTMLTEAADGQGKLLTGTICGFTRGWDRKVLVDVEGKKGYLGYRHLQKRGLRLQEGTVLRNLKVEAEDDKGWLILSVHSTDQSQETQEEPHLLKLRNDDANCCC
eukprot:TRINITY_DN44461_c0_g1_i1.p1 TRINITY_DN44461_c0_g1~~TRINITY_DN44461_c0_g1_i1.p1  ORF type:complete len:377 (-),score=63.23 TRINITY_DN44461_c0_g1_i1:71-1201(-)